MDQVKDARLSIGGSQDFVMPYIERTYRLQSSPRLVRFEVKVKETDLLIQAERNLSEAAGRVVRRYRRELEEYIAYDPDFATTFSPCPVPSDAPEIVRTMAGAALLAGVGPMAAVAGAVAEFVGRELLQESREVIVENGGDLFLTVEEPVRIGIFAGTSPLSNRVAIMIDPEQTPAGLCTSSGTVGPSVSFGVADAATILAETAALADAAASTLGNAVQSPDDIHSALEEVKSIPGVLGALVICKDKLGAWGQLRLEPL